MNIKLKNKIEDMYEEWLMVEYPDEIKNKDDLIEKMCDGYRYDEFVEELKKVL